MAKRLIGAAFNGAKISTSVPIKIIRRVIESKAVQQSIAIGSIEQYQNDLVITYSEDDTEIVDVTVEMNDMTIATTGAISGAIYTALQLQFLRRWRGLSRAKVAEQLVLKIEANITLIQQLLSSLRGEALAFQNIKSADEIASVRLGLMSVSNRQTNLNVAVRLMNDNVDLLRFANRLGIDVAREVPIERIESLRTLWDKGMLFPKGTMTNFELAEYAFMSDAEVLEFQSIINSSKWFSSNKGALEVASQFVDADDVLGLKEYINQTKAILDDIMSVTNQNRIMFENLSIALGGSEFGFATKMAQGFSPAELVVIADVVKTAADDILRASVGVTELRQTGAGISVGVGKAEKTAVLAGMGRTAQAVYRFSPTVARHLGLVGRFAGYVALIDLAIWAGTGLLIDLPLNLFMDEEEQGFFADRAGFSFIGEGIEWLFLKAFNEIYPKAPESLYEAFMTMFIGAIAADNFQTATEIITRWFIDNISVDILVPLGWDIQLDTIDGITILDRFIPPKDPLIILEIGAYLITYKLVFTLWVLPAFNYLNSAIKS